MSSLGSTAEVKVMEWLESYGIGCQRMPHKTPFDIQANEKRIEVKAGTYRDGSWRLNIHRHGVLNERMVDVYVFRLEGHPNVDGPIHLVLRAPLRRATVEITPRSIVRKFYPAIGRLSLIDPNIGNESAPECLKREHESIPSPKAVSPVLTDTELLVFDAMKYIGRRTRRIPSQAELAEVCGCSTATISRAFDRLEAKGFISTDIANVRRAVRSFHITNFKRVRHV